MGKRAGLYAQINGRAPSPLTSSISSLGKSLRYGYTKLGLSDDDIVEYKKLQLLVKIMICRHK